MSKRPTPKKQTAKIATKQRYAKFAEKSKRKIKNRVNLTTCDNCKAVVPVHCVCAECGKYKAKNILTKGGKSDKITKIAV